MLRRAALLIAFVVAFDPAGRAQRVDATEVLAAARQALGGEQTLSALKTFVATGRTRQLRGDNLVPIEFEIDCELPDKYVRKDEFPAQDVEPTLTGFRGDEVIQAASARAGPAGPQRLAAIKQDFARLMLGVVAGPVPSYPVTFKYAAAGQAPEGMADILDVAGPANFAARLVIQQQSHLPVMVMWSGPPPAARVSGAAGPPPGGAAPPPVEYRMYFADYRPVERLKWPFRIRRAVGGTTIEETTFDRVAVNVRIDPKKFEAPR